MSAGESRSTIFLCLALLLVGLYLAAGPIVRLSDWHVGDHNNPALAEALAWREGRLDIGRPFHNTAHYNGRYYNLHPPAFTLICLAATWLGERLGVPIGTFHESWYIALVALMLPMAGYWAFLQITRRAAWAALFTAYLILATALLPMLRACIDGPLNEIQHCLATTGLLLVAGDLLGRRRLWPALIGLALAAWSRQLTLFYALPILWLAWCPTISSPRIAIRGLTIVMILFIITPLLTLNYLKFDHPLDNGYRHLYANWDPGNWHVQRVERFGVISPHFIPENLRYLLLEPPRFRWTTHYLTPDNHLLGVAITWTNPLLLLLLIDIRRWWREPAARALMLASLFVIAALAVYHSPGASQPGYYRFALDFIPIWLAVLAPAALLTPARRAWTLALFAYSACYFHFLLA